VGRRGEGEHDEGEDAEAEQGGETVSEAHLGLIGSENAFLNPCTSTPKREFLLGREIYFGPGFWSSSFVPARVN
jgi:hypothetical protein